MDEQKIINDIIEFKFAKVLETISAKDIKKYEIPSWALKYDGINAPEGGIFVTSQEKLKAGDLVFAHHFNQYVVITHVLPNKEYIATKFISGPNIPIVGVNEPQVPYVD